MGTKSGDFAQQGKRKWLKEEDFNKDEKNRIQTRFKSEIISKLEKYSNSNAKDLGY